MIWLLLAGVPVVTGALLALPIAIGIAVGFARWAIRDLTGIDLFLADAVTGKVKTKLVAPSVGSHFDALSFLYSAGSWSPDARVSPVSSDVVRPVTAAS